MFRKPRQGAPCTLRWTPEPLSSIPADVYGDGRSERIIADVLKERDGDRPFVATKAGRRLSPHVAEGFTKDTLTAFVDRSRDNLQTDCLDLVQLHCPPAEVYYRPDVFDVMDGLVQGGKIRNYGVSVEKIEEALKAIEYPGVKIYPDHL